MFVLALHTTQYDDPSASCLLTIIDEQISLAEMHKIIPQFLREFKVELVEPGKEWSTHDVFFNKQEGILVRLYKR